MNEDQSQQSRSAASGLITLVLAALLAVPLTRSVLGSDAVRASLASEVLRHAHPGGDRAYDHLLHKTVELERTPRSADERFVCLTGSSVIMLNVGLPQMRAVLADRLPEKPVRLEKLTGGHATVRDIRRWLENLPGRKPEVLLFGVYYNTLQPSHRRPDMRLWFPPDNATYLRAIYVSATVNVHTEWDPDGPEPRFTDEWSPKRWPADSDGLLRPYDPFPNVETEALSDFARYCRGEGIRLVLVRTPINPAFYPVYRKARHYEAYGEALEATRKYGAEVWNLETALGEDPKRFHDLVHLNARGHARFSRLLADRIAQYLRGLED